MGSKLSTDTMKMLQPPADRPKALLQATKKSEVDSKTGRRGGGDGVPQATKKSEGDSKEHCESKETYKEREARRHTCIWLLQAPVY